MTQAIKDFILHLVGPQLSVLICSMIPIIELRGSIPLGAALGLPFAFNYILSVVREDCPQLDGKMQDQAVQQDCQLAVPKSRKESAQD